MPDYSLILSINYFGNEWSMSANDYSTLQWYSNTSKPTQAELDALWQSTQDIVAKDACKAKAKELLAKSDWSQMPDVGLKNSADFVTYRGILRGLVISPVTNPDFPVELVPVWE